MITKTYHVCTSIASIERMLEEKRRKHQKQEIPWLMVGERPATRTELLEVIKESKAKGYDVIPPCDNVDSKGRCAGHTVSEEMS